MKCLYTVNTLEVFRLVSTHSSQMLCGSDAKKKYTHTTRLCTHGVLQCSRYKAIINSITITLFCGTKWTALHKIWACAVRESRCYPVKTHFSAKRETRKSTHERTSAKKQHIFHADVHPNTQQSHHTEWNIHLRIVHSRKFCCCAPSKLLRSCVNIKAVK